jgi:heavy metal sensor kinase
VSIRTRLTLWYSGVLALIVIVMGGFLVWRLRVDLVNNLDASLANRADQTAAALEDPEDPRELLDLEELAGRGAASLRSSGIVTQVISPDGRVVRSIGEEVKGTLLPSGAARSMGTDVHATVKAGDDDFRILATRLTRTRNILVVANSMEPAEQATRGLVVLLVLALPEAIAASAAVGYVLARRAFAPIDEMTRTAAAIGGDDAAARLTVPTIEDEVGRLGRTLNDMLDRLQRALAEQRRFVADASHELRTPLAIMQSEIDVALRSSGTPPEARPVLASTGEEVRRMTRIVEGLLTLAQADEGRLQLSRTDVDLAEMAKAVAGRLDLTASAKHTSITVDSPVPVVVNGDQMRLDQLITNLVENAVKYAPEGSSVRVGVRSNDGSALISVADSGPGISRADTAHIFDRFYRVDKARARDAGGAGLGLAICRSIAFAHNGDISVESTVGEGTVFEVRLPLG